MLRWSIASVCMGGALEDKFAAAKAGFRAVEIFENDLTFFRGKPMALAWGNGSRTGPPPGITRTRITK